MTFEPENSVDGSLSTCWHPEKSHDGGAGEWIEFLFSREVLLNRVEVANGFQTTYRGSDLFRLNNRIDRGRLVFSSGQSFEVQFGSDERGFITISLDPPVATRSVKLIAETVHRGSRWNDLAISEVRFRAVR